MRRTMALLTLAALITIGLGEARAAQHQAGGHMPMGQTGGQAGPAGAHGQPGGMMGTTCPMMGMMPMMGHMMARQSDPTGMGMMSMMGMMGGGMDPKTLGRMLELRGELLKAMGEVLLKHGKALQQTP